MLTINLRIIRPGTAIVPDEWIEVARYRESDLSRRHAYPDQWNLMAILLYAFGCFSVKPDPSRSGAQRKSQPAIASEAAPSQQQAANRAKNVQPPAGPKVKMPRFRTRPNLAHHHSDVVNAYCLSSASYVTDELFLDIKELEYDVNNKPIPIGDGDSPKKSRFYKEGCLQFGRDIFRDYSYKWKDMEEIQMEESFISQGKYACYQLEEYFCEELCAVGAPERSLFTTHVRMLAHSVGELRYSACQRRSHLLLTRHPFEWTEIGLDVRREDAKYSEANIERNLAMVMAYATLNDEDERTISGLRTLQIRRTHGWVRDDD
ncbi:hypothetical protein NQ176_g6532 [Zarea fungicola]|uniref:Uncharacterized protein n=1 Tax=Zarea fungicola TaxID=93591 RepID=A0ACC1N560_9HYPO|nr:hypothetical protein NQ176_g6532 [Lecanicillium fungicola]